MNYIDYNCIDKGSLSKMHKLNRHQCKGNGVKILILHKIDGIKIIRIIEKKNNLPATLTLKIYILNTTI